MASRGQNNQCTPATALHPLLNHLILENVFGYLKHTDLKNARLVCHFWNKTAAGKIQDTSHIHLTPHNLSDYILLFQHSEIQNKKFLLNGFDIQLRVNAYGYLTAFLLKFGANVKEIVFSECKFFKEGFWKIFSSLPELEIVSFGNSTISCFSDCQVAETEPEELVKQQNSNFLICKKVTSVEIVVGRKCILPPWSEIFRHFQNIKSLQVQLQKSADLTEMLAALTQSQPPILLTDFCSCIQLGENHVQHLLDLSSNLASIDIILDDSVTPELVAHFLRNCSNTLKTLKLSRGSVLVSENLDPIPKFPYNINFKQLTNLEINNDLLESFNFLQNTPNLKNLFVLQDDAEEDDISFSKLIQNCANKSNNLEFHPPSKLEILSMQYFLSSCCVRRIGENISPNIKKLSLYLDDESIRSVYSHLLNLEELWVFGTEVTDEGITGIPFKVLLNDDINEKEDFREFAYIGHCLKLRKFGVYSQPQENISDFSVDFGLLDIKELTSLDLPQTAITDEGIRAILQNSNIVNLQAKYFVEDGTLTERGQDLQKLL